MTGRPRHLLFPIRGKTPVASAYLAPFLAHQGGWDEILLVGGPLAVIALLLWLANRRVAAKLEEQAAEEQANA